MRFLLYPRTTALLSSTTTRRGKQGSIPDSYAVVAKAVAAGTSPALHQQETSKVVSQSSSRHLLDRHDVTVTSQTRTDGATAGKLTRAWGQQCSPKCGCVVRFEATIDSDTRAIVSASYQAKTLVTLNDSTAKKAEENSCSTDDGSPQLRAVLTAKGRPMFKKCTCKSLHHLSAAVVEHVVASPIMGTAPVTMSRLAATLEFDSTRSSTSFRKTVLKSQGLPETDTHCFDVVEEAVTALVKRRLPKPRKRETEDDEEVLRRILVGGDDGDDGDEYYDPERRKHFAQNPHTAWNLYNYDDDDDSALGSFLWKEHDYRVLLGGGGGGKLSVGNGNSRRETTAAAAAEAEFDNGPRPMSTLRMFDDRVAERERDDAKRRRQRRDVEDASARDGARSRRKRVPPPSDWVSYVDELYSHPTG